MPKPMLTGLRVIRGLIPVTLIVMILLRLVWIQIRPYRPIVSEYTQALAAQIDELHQGSCRLHDVGAHVSEIKIPKLLIYLVSWASSKDCQDGKFGKRLLLRLNHWFYVGSVIALTFCTRLLTGSWSLSLAVAAILLSRGSLLAAGERLDSRVLLQCMGAVIFTLASHFLRSGSVLMLGAIGCAIGLAAYLDPVFLPLFGMPLVLLLLGFALRNVVKFDASVWQKDRRRDAFLKRKGSGGWAARLTGDENIHGFFPLIMWLLKQPSLVDDNEMRRGSGTREDDSARERRGSLTMPLALPFFQWIGMTNQWRFYFLLFSAGPLLGLAMLLALQGLPTGDAAWWEAWKQTSLGSRVDIGGFPGLVDWHWLLSLLVSAAFLLQRPVPGLQVIKGGVVIAWAMLIGIAASEALLGAGTRAGWGDFALSLYLMQPVFLLLGVCSVYAFIVKVSIDR